MIQVGGGDRVNHYKITAITGYGSAQIVRNVQAARDEGRLIDCTRGKKTRSVVFLESGQVVTSNSSQAALAERWDREMGKYKQQ